MIKKLVLLAIVPLALLAFAQLGTMAIVMHSWNAIVNYASPFTGPLPAGKSGQALTDQVVLVMVDALRDDASKQMAQVNSLRAKGASLTLRVGQPSLSLPGWTVIGTGTWQEQSGVTTNWYEGPVKVDSIFAEAKKKGLRTAVVGSGGWAQLYAGSVDTIKTFRGPPDPYTNWEAVAREDDQFLAAALQVLKDEKPALLLAYFSGPDDAGHGQGADSDTYRRVVQGIDARIGQLAAALDLKSTTLIVTADHGMLDRGGHGGWEESVLNVPFVAAGKGIKPGTYPAGQQADIAATMAVLLGTAVPVHSQGQAQLDLLDMPDKLRAERAFDVAQELGGFYAQYARQIGAMPLDHSRLAAADAALAKGDFAASYQASRGFYADIQQQAAAAKESRLGRDRLGRLPYVLLLLAPFAVWLYVVYRQKWGLGVPLVGALAYFLIYNGLFFAAGNSYSLSAFNSEDQIAAFFGQRGTDALVALLLAGILAGILSRRKTIFEGAMAGVNTMFLVALGLGAQALIFYWWWDVSFSWYLPDMLWGFKYYLDMLQTIAFYPRIFLPVAAILPFLTLGARWVTRRVRA